MHWLFAKQKGCWLTESALWMVVALAGVMTCGMITGCRESAPEGRSVSEPQRPRAAVASSQKGIATQKEASGSSDQAVLDAQLGIMIEASTEWKVGDDVSIPLTVSNGGEQTINDLELRAEVQFGLQDSISEGRMVIPIKSLPPKMSYQVWVNFLSSRPGIWYVKAAIYHESELIKATTRTLYIREATVQQQQQPVDDDSSLGPPLVEHPERLQRLHPEFPIWLDAEGRALVMIGRVCQREAPLELFACLKNFKEHESVVSINTRAYIVHAGLLALGLEPGNPVQFYPEYRPATGPEVDIFVVWKDADGKIQRRPAQDWVRDVNTKQAMSSSWIFTGSQIVKDEDTGEQYYYADSTGELICVSNFPSAVLDLPIRSTDSNESLLFEAFTENIPPLGTPVTVILTPKQAATSESSAQAAEESSKLHAEKDAKSADTRKAPSGQTDE